MQVIFKAPANNWHELGGTEDSLFDTVELTDEKSFFYQKWYGYTFRYMYACHLFVFFGVKTWFLCLYE